MEVSPLNKADGRSLINMVPHCLKKAFSSLSEEDFGFTEERYEREYGRVDTATNLLRIAFWREYETAQANMRKMGIDAIAFGCGMLVGQVRSTLSNRTDLRWVLIPPLSYENFLDEALSFGLNRLRKDILGAKIYDEEGRLDVRAADLLLKAVAFIDMRRNGMPTSRSENVHVISRTSDLKSITSQKSLKEIDARIKELESRGVVDRAKAVVEMDMASSSSPSSLAPVIPAIGYPSVSSKEEEY
jgi:hypothetical protein